MTSRSRQIVFVIAASLGICAAVGAAITLNDLRISGVGGGSVRDQRGVHRETGEGRRATTFSSEGSAAVAPDDLSQIVKVVDASPAGSAQLGFSIAVSGDTAVVGAPGEANNRGAVFIYIRNGSAWQLQQEIIGADSVADDHFGWSVDIDGETIVVGAYDINEVDQGAAYVFTRNGLSWSQQQKITPAGGIITDQFGSSVAISGDTIIVGAFGRDSSRGSAYVYIRNASAWHAQQTLTAADAASGDEFGWSVGLSGDRALVGAPGDDALRGGAYIFERNGAAWSETAKLVGADSAALDRFGYGVGITGTSAVVGAPLDNDNSILSGSAYVFTESGSGWQQQAKLLSSDRAGNDKFGGSVAIDGSAILVGANGDDLANLMDQGSGYLFALSGGVWTQAQKLIAPDGNAGDNFGGAVDLAAGSVAVGAYLADVSAQKDAGSAYLFRDPAQPSPSPTPTPTPEFVLVGGQVLTSDGRGLRSGLVTITDVLLGTKDTTSTSSLGYFQFQVVSGRDYVISVNSKRYRYSQVPITADGDVLNIQLVGLE